MNYNSFFDLEFEGEVDGVAAAVAGPEGGAGLHGEADGLVLVEAARLGVVAGDEFDKSFGSPQAAQGGTAILHVHLAEEHAVDVYHGKMVSLVILVPQDVAGGIVQMQHLAVVHRSGEMAQGLGHLLIGALAGIAKFI